MRLLYTIKMWIVLSWKVVSAVRVEGQLNNCLDGIHSVYIIKICGSTILKDVSAVRVDGLLKQLPWKWQILFCKYLLCHYSLFLKVFKITFSMTATTTMIYNFTISHNRQRTRWFTSASYSSLHLQPTPQSLHSFSRRIEKVDCIPRTCKFPLRVKPFACNAFWSVAVWESILFLRSKSSKVTTATYSAPTVLIITSLFIGIGRLSFVYPDGITNAILDTESPISMCTGAVMAILSFPVLFPPKMYFAKVPKPLLPITFAKWCGSRCNHRHRRSRIIPNFEIILHTIIHCTPAFLFY